MEHDLEKMKTNPKLVKRSWLPLWKNIDSISFEPRYVDAHSGYELPKYKTERLPKTKTIIYQKHRIFNICRLVYDESFCFIPVESEKAVRIYEKMTNEKD